MKSSPNRTIPHGKSLRLQKFSRRKSAFLSTLASLTLSFFPSSGAWAKEVRDLIPYVSPFVSRGGVQPGPKLPWGSVHPSPNTQNGMVNGYNPNAHINGFSQLQISGTGGRGEYGNLMISPQVGALVVDSNGHASQKLEEAAKCCHYSVKLDRYKVKAEMTPTHNAALYKFTFPASSESHLFLDLAANIPGDYQKKSPDNIEKLTAGEVKLEPASGKMSGWVALMGGGVMIPYKLYFVAQFSKAPQGHGTNHNKTVTAGSTAQKVVNTADRIGAYFKYTTTADEVISMKIAVSFSSIRNAEKFLAAQIPAYDFAQAKSDCEKKWNQHLSTVLLDGATEAQKKTFYTALYHAAMAPHDRTGDNPYWSNAEPYYDDHYAVWDTWRTLWPLNSLLFPRTASGVVRSMVDRFEHNFTIRDVFTKGGETNYIQGGDNPTNVIVDAYMKNVPGVDWERAYRAVKHIADGERTGDYIHKNRGWTSSSSSKSLEFSYNDYCVYLLAKGLGKTAEAEVYRVRSMQWEKLFNKTLVQDGYTGFMGGLDDSGRTTGGNFYEGGNWDYSYFAPHDFARLIQLMGGKETYANRLKWAIENNKINFANEPSFMTVRSFHYAGRPDLTAEKVRFVFTKGGNNSLGFGAHGYPGDEDGGAMSSWYVLSALGLFPNSGQDVYLLNGPLYPKATLQLENGKNLVIEGENAGDAAPYIQSASWNGAPLSKTWLRHADIANGGTLKFTMGAAASSWGHSAELPPSLGSTGAPAPLPQAAAEPASGPFMGITPTIPGLIQAENYDYGGPGKGFQISGTPRNPDWTYKYRFDGFFITDLLETKDINPGEGRGKFVITLGAGSWTRYTVNVLKAGKYDIELGIYTQKKEAGYRIDFGNGRTTGSFKGPMTWGWNRMYVKDVDLVAGTQTMTVNGEVSAPGLHYLLFYPAGTSPTVKAPWRHPEAMGPLRYQYYDARGRLLPAAAKKPALPSKIPGAFRRAMKDGSNRP